MNITILENVFNITFEKIQNSIPNLAKFPHVKNLSQEVLTELKTMHTSFKILIQEIKNVDDDRAMF